MARPLRRELLTHSESCGQRPAIDLMIVCILAGLGSGLAICFSWLERVAARHRGGLGSSLALCLSKGCCWSLYR